MKDNLKIMKRKEMVLNSMQMVMFFVELFQETRNMEKEYFFGSI